jgi:hypothetical protein
MFGNDLPLIANQLPVSFDLPEDQEQWRIEMELMVKRIANVVNTKEGALYVPQEVATFQLYFTPPPDTQVFRNTYRFTFDMVALNGGVPLAPTTPYSFAHGIVGITQATMIWGTAVTDDVPPRFVPLPYVSQVEAEEIQIYMTATTINIVTGSNTLTSCLITTEYLKN